MSFHFSDPLLVQIYEWIVFVHVFSVFGFLISHGASAAIGFRLREERNLERLRALLDLSARSYRGLIITFFLILGSGGILGWMGGWWQFGWFWTAIVVLFAITFTMTPLVAMPYNKVRRALGLRPPMQRREPKIPPPKVEEIDGILRSAQPMLSAIIGFGGLAFLLWLMMFEPF